MWRTLVITVYKGLIENEKSLNPACFVLFCDDLGHQIIHKLRTLLIRLILFNSEVQKCLHLLVIGLRRSRLAYDIRLRLGSSNLFVARQTLLRGQGRFSLQPIGLMILVTFLALAAETRHFSNYLWALFKVLIC